MLIAALLVLPGLALAQGTPSGQPRPAPTTPPGPEPVPAPLLGMFKKATQWRLEQISANHLRFTGQVEIEGDDVKFFADEVDIYTDENRLVAAGNVVFSNPEGRISAERVVFNTKTNTGTFYQAFGVMSVGTAASSNLAAFGGQDPDVYFYGEELEKLAQKKYRITRGGFTTCVQPTPRWEVTSSNVVLNLDEYAVATNTLLRVKGVPVFYLPMLYYPIQKDQRSTGFLLPTYGTSTLRGQAVSNAFFWAIDRSQDATFLHDWFTRSGQGAGGEYRYVAGPASQGNFKFYRFSRKETTFTDSEGTSILPANQSFELTGVATQSLGRATRGRIRLEYFSDLLTQQLYHQNIYQATRRSRVVEAGLTNSTGPVATSVLYQRNETFNAEKSSVVYGGTPRITASLAPQRLFDLPLYGSIGSDFSYLPYRYITDGVVTLDNSLGRFDFVPTLRAPLSRLTFLSINSSASYRTTRYSRSVDAGGTVVPEGFTRQYLQMRSEVIGPVFTRIWDLPESGIAERLKHVIEPAFTVDYTSAINEYRRAPVLSDISDFVVGGASRFTYGLNNRLFYRGRTVDGVRGQTREFVTIGIQQTYYSNPESSQYDTAYSSANRGRRAADLSPVALAVRVSPSTAFDSTTRMEYDVSGGSGLQVFTTSGNVNGSRGSTALSYSRRRLMGSTESDDYLNASTSVRLRDGRVTGTYALSWDIARSYVVSQNIHASYLAQCCGVQVEFQRFNYPESSGSPISSDRRFNFSFILAGLGTFSNFFGAFGAR
ncbi:MAG: putative LPS assembly protein LptD [Vicinamibacterales bacterium]